MKAKLEIDKAITELEKYQGVPRCVDCGWKYGTDITKYCSCIQSNNTPERKAKWLKALSRARELQAIVNAHHAESLKSDERKMAATILSGLVSEYAANAGNDRTGKPLATPAPSHPS